jgi:hypothetical protein
MRHGWRHLINRKPRRSPSVARRQLALSWPAVNICCYMYENWPVNVLVASITALTVALAVLIHYEGLVWLFGLALWLLVHVPDAGNLNGVAQF